LISFDCWRHEGSQHHKPSWVCRALVRGAHSEKCGEAQNKPIEGCRRGLSRNSSPCSRYSKSSVIFLSYGFFEGSGSFVIFIAIRRTSSCVSTLAVDCRPWLILEIGVAERLSVVIADDKTGV